MKKLIYILIITSFVICNLSFVICASALADSILIVPSFGGGALDLQSTTGTVTTHLWDIKGQPVSGVSTAADGSQIQFGGIYVLGTGEAGGGVVAAGETGIITQTTIVRTADDDSGQIKITWNKGTAAAVDVWRLSGVGTEFSTSSTGWTKVIDNSAVSEYTEPTDQVKVHDGKNSYYRVVPSGTVITKLFDAANNNKTVGKVDVGFPLGYTLLGVPLWFQDVTLNTIIGKQLPVKDPGDELYSYGMDKSTFSSGSWVGNPLKFEKNRGYYIHILSLPAGQSKKIITFVGLVDTSAASIVINRGYSMIGNPYPFALNVQNVFPDVFSGDSSSSGDELYDKFANKKTFTSTGWVGAPYMFGIGDGFWFKRVKSDNYNWKLSQ